MREKNIRNIILRFINQWVLIHNFTTSFVIRNIGWKTEYKHITCHKRITEKFIKHFTHYKNEWCMAIMFKVQTCQSITWKDFIWSGCTQNNAAKIIVCSHQIVRRRLLSFPLVECSQLNHSSFQSYGLIVAIRIKYVI